MKLLFEIEYRTQWGEQLVLLWGRRRIVLHYVENGLWRGVCDAPRGGDGTTYRYTVEREGVCIRTEWRCHRLRLPRGLACREVRIRDRWQELPAGAAFLSSAFTRAVFARRQGRTEGAAEPRPVGKAPGGEVLLRVVAPDIRPDEQLAIASERLDGWQRMVPFDDGEFPEWSLRLTLPEGAAFKLLVIDRATGRPVVWEEGENRRWSGAAADGELLVEASLTPRLPERQWHGAGTAIPVFSLRSRESFGVGEFADLKLLIDWAAATRQRVIQLLPVNDTTMTRTWEDSYPYNANSIYALHPQFLRLTAAGVAEDEEYCRLRDELNALEEVDYERVNAAKERLLRATFARCGARTAARADYKAFVEANRHWLLPYAAYRCLRDEYGTTDFAQWGPYARYERRKVEAYCLAHSREVGYHCWVQYHLHLQLSEVSRYAHSRGIVLKGDLPIGIGRTSADAWQSPRLFHLDSQAGAPPDAFSEVGQNWGFPTYDWERMAHDGYAWWRARLHKMAEYFDAYRIDHILGFFRIWEIPAEALHGLLGHFNPAMPYSAGELRGMGFDLSEGRYVTPPLDDATLGAIFGELADEVRRDCIRHGRLVSSCSTQRRAAARYPGEEEHDRRMRGGLMTLLDDVLFVEDPYRKGYYHPRIAARGTRSFALLPGWQQEAFMRLHDDFFYRRHDRFWQESALRKLPVLLTATDMLACGEDLGMIPDCVPATMRMLQILSLEIQRMPKRAGERFAATADYPYLSVCSTSTHDMTPLRAWWREERATTQHFYNEVLRCPGEAPAECEPWLCRRIVEMHLTSPAMFAILPLQDWLAMDEELRAPDPEKERINVPAIPRYYWRYRMHLTLEQLLAAEDFNTTLCDMIAVSGRG
ncbi:4-alpha-glucanotransferase [Alistipes sp. An31A]|uniref:4-alpha-glucanotransferase n=1 Tax=Alistipes sp. An31A TaxID=1965631 RepID=UPI000B3A96EB|nr:4-alpha-glucanotransferase [Alistipes sp. An31A]OUO19648.1 4-alpha-glucanotransferase [Alistipes sp. An31A]